MKEPLRDPAILAHMKTAFDLYETAEIMMRQNLRRRYPEAEEAEIESLFATWLRRLPVGKARGSDQDHSGLERS